MKLLWHAIFAILLVLSLSTQAARISQKTQTDEAVGFSDSLAKLGAHAITAPSANRVAVVFPDCSQPVIIARVGFAGTNQNMLNVAAEQWVQRYIYLGVVSPQLDFTGTASRWAKAKTLAVLGLRQTAVPASVVQVSWPKGCSTLESRDWSVLSP
jgi:hypothetical protein